MQLQNIPAELRALPNWCVCGANIVPINPRTNKAAEPNNPETWVTFDECAKAVEKDGFQYLGMMFDPSHDYVCIDFDDKFDKPALPEEHERCKRIVEAFGCYAEKSRSGRGVHIFVKGRVPRMVGRGNFQLYQYPHFIVFTGNTLQHPPLPILEQQALLDELFADVAPVSFGSADISFEDDDAATQSDDEVRAMAAAAFNAAKYALLTRDPDSWREAGLYESQSDADYALMGMFTFYTKSNAQARRLFLASALGQRAKASRADYIPRMIARQRARQAATQPQTVDLDFARKMADAMLSKPASVDTAELEDEPRTLTPVNFPPGMIGDVARYIMRSANRTVPEIALAAAIALTAGIAGRAYNTETNTGLNLYIMLLGRTGIGKESASDGIDAIITKLRERVPNAPMFRGPGAFASGQGLLRTLAQSPCFVSVLGEVGSLFSSLCHARANPADKLFLRVMLDVYSKSGRNQALHSSAYADKEKNIAMVQSPALTLLGESVPESFYAAMTPDHISSGLVPRFLVIETKADRVPMNDAADRQIPESLLQQLELLTTTAITAQANNVSHIVPSDAAARKVLRAYDRECDTLINASTADVDRQIYNRAHLQVLRLSALAAVGVNPRDPIVTVDLAQWAIELVRRCASGVAAHYSGEDESTSNDGVVIIKRAVASFCAMTPRERRNQGATMIIATSKDAIVPRAFIIHYCKRRQPFAADREPRAAVEREIASMLLSDILATVDPAQAREKYGVRNAPLYCVGPAFRLA